ncbi:unnamed protein product [Arabis nemorensis]|uniref:RNase H type-1 domain-containing protein n=1 Tax=Arabis nemorensis TaxID=586526 RepID=A0A565BQD7_9BRAS|nr:unnamed protein product [Arabis nemorensis]
MEDAEEWFVAREVQEEGEGLEMTLSEVRMNKWRRPPEGWLKCNIGFSWNQKEKFGGSSWVLRDFKGLMVLHSRKTFGVYETEADFKLAVLIWGIESIISHRKEKVIFSAQQVDLIEALLRPKAWPNFSYQVQTLLHTLSPLLEWRVEAAIAGSNRGAFLIAQSVTMEFMIHSYVAAGYPLWLRDLFMIEQSD